MATTRRQVITTAAALLAANRAGALPAKPAPLSPPVKLTLGANTVPHVSPFQYIAEEARPLGVNIEVVEIRALCRHPHRLGLRLHRHGLDRPRRRADRAQPGHQNGGCAYGRRNLAEEPYRRQGIHPHEMGAISPASASASRPVRRCGSSSPPRSSRPASPPRKSSRSTCRAPAPSWCSRCSAATSTPSSAGNRSRAWPSTRASAAAPKRSTTASPKPLAPSSGWSASTATSSPPSARR